MPKKCYIQESARKPSANRYTQLWKITHIIVIYHIEQDSAD